VALSFLELPHIRVSIPVEDFHLPARVYVTEEVAIGRLMSPTEHDHEDILREQGGQ
jgi:hypothetical protein